MRRNRSSRRVLTTAGAGLLFFGAIALGMIPASADTLGTAAVHAAQATPVTGGVVPCSSLDTSGTGITIVATDTCAAMPCPSGIDCGDVVAGPTADLGAGQYVYLNFFNFEPGDAGVTVYYCADPGAASTLTAVPTCANQDTSSYSENRQQIGIYPASTSTLIPQGTATASMQAAEVSAPSDPISAQQFNPTVDEPGFYCDGTTANACSIVVTDASITPGHPASTSANSVEIPLSFTPTSTGCASSASVVSTESEFGIDLLMPVVASLSCAADPKDAVLPFETATDGYQAVKDLTTGSQQIAFTDDPESPDQQALLSGGGYALIPVALTANVVAFDAEINSRTTNENYNLGQLNLTPTMAAGLLTDASNYPDAQSTDDQDACSGPSAGTTDTTGTCLFGPAPCYGGATCALFLQLNYISGFTQYTTFQSVQRSDTAGATAQLFNWLCGAPKVPLDFGVGAVELMSGAQELELGLSPASGPTLTTCPATADQVPAIAGQQRLITVNDPSQQALKAGQAVYQSGVSTGATAAFADMNWAESEYYGMDVASLQNAAGAFVTPSATSLDAALADAKANPDGSFTPQNLASDPAAYPMPSVIYAVVPTASEDPADATAVTALLNDLLDITSAGGSNAADLPDGFVPLPASVAKQASADVTKDITTVAATTPPATTPPPASTSGSGTNSIAFTGLGQLSFGSAITAATGINFVNGAGLDSTAAAVEATSRAQHHSDVPTLGPNLPSYALVASHGKAILPEAFILGIIALAFGCAFIGTGIFRRRRSLAAAAEAGAGTEGEPSGEGP